MQMVLAEALLDSSLHGLGIRECFEVTQTVHQMCDGSWHRVRLCGRGGGRCLSAWEVCVRATGTGMQPACLVLVGCLDCELREWLPHRGCGQRCSAM